MFKKLLVALSLAVGLMAQPVEAAHPVLHMPGGKQDSLQARYTDNYNDTQIDRLIQWCSENYSTFTYAYLTAESSVYGFRTAAVRNFALTYAIYPYYGATQLYAAKAVELINSLVLDPPGTATRMADVWRNADYYNARSSLYGIACVYDWTYNYMSDSERYNIRKALVEGCEQFYADAHQSSKPAIDEAAWGSNRPHNNYHYGELLGFTAAAIAVGEDTTAVEYVLTFLMDTMLVETQKAIFAHESFIESNRIYDDSVGRDIGGIHVESTAYGANSTEFFGVLVDLLARKNDTTVAFYAHDYFSQTIVAQAYATYPGASFDGRYKMFGEGKTGGGNLLGPEASAMVVSAALCSDADTAGLAKWWLATMPMYSVTETYGYRLSNYVLFWDDDITEVSDFTAAQTYYASGPQYLFIRGAGEPFDNSSDGMLLTFRGGISGEDHCHPGYGNITWYKGGFGIADPALLEDDGAQSYINDYYHNTTAVDTCSAGYITWRAKLFWDGISTLEHTATESGEYVYYAFDFSKGYLAMPDYKCNTVKHREREFLYVVDDTLLFLFDRVASYSTRRCVVDSVFYIYPITWSMYTQGTINAGNTAFEITPKYGPYKFAGFIADPDTNLVRYLPDETHAEMSDDMEVLRYRPWDVDSTVTIASALWMNTQAHPDSLFRVQPTVGNMLGIGASAVLSPNLVPIWIDYVALFATDIEGDTGSVWATGDSIHLGYGRPSDSVVVYLLDMSSKVDSFAYKITHQKDTLVLTIKRSKGAGYTRCIATSAGVVTIHSGSSGGTVPAYPPPAPPTKGGRERVEKSGILWLALPFGLLCGKRRRYLALLTIMLLFIPIGANAVPGMKKNCTDLVGLITFRDYGGNLFRANSLWISLDEDASGNVTLYRLLPSLAAVDSTGTFVLKPGESYSIPVSGIYAVAFSKVTATDCFKYLPLAEGEVSTSSSSGTFDSEALDSLVTLLSGPSTVTFSDPIMLWGVVDFANTGTQRAQTLPAIGENVTGATSLLCYADWKSLTGQFSIQLCVGPTLSSADTFLTYPIDSGMWVPNTVYTRFEEDSTYTYTTTNTCVGSSPTQNFWRIDSVTVKQHATDEGIVFRVYNNGHPFLGFLRARVIVDGADDIENFRFMVIKEYGGM